VNSQGPSEHTCGHGRALFDYEEGLLGEAERAEIERAVAECPGCRAQLEELRRLKRLVKASAQTDPCPDEWRLFEFIEYGTDPEGRIEAHVTACPRCRETLRVMSASSGESIPEALRAKIAQKKASSEGARQTSPADQALPVGAGREKRSTQEPFWETIARFFRPGVWTAALAGAAAVFLFVFMYSGDFPQDVAMLSSVSWEGTPRPKGLQLADCRAAFIVAAGDRTRPVPRERADEMYQALAPTMELWERCRIIAPDKVSDTLKNATPRPRSLDDALKLLGRTVGLTEAVVITLDERNGRVDAQVRLMDPASGAVTAERRVSGYSESALPKAVRDAAFALLEERVPSSATVKPPHEK
jgi:uncharacterized protein with PIN domain